MPSARNTRALSTWVRCAPRRASRACRGLESKAAGAPCSSEIGVARRRASRGRLWLRARSPGGTPT
eukprot:12367672-Alexandrium_andersonii.AAC.1